MVKEIFLFILPIDIHWIIQLLLVSCNIFYPWVSSSMGNLIIPSHRVINYSFNLLQRPVNVSKQFPRDHTHASKCHLATIPRETTNPVTIFTSNQPTTTCTILLPHWRHTHPSRWGKPPSNLDQLFRTNLFRNINLLGLVICAYTMANHSISWLERASQMIYHGLFVTPLPKECFAIRGVIHRHPTNPLAPHPSEVSVEVSII